MQNPASPAVWGAREWGVFHKKTLTHSNTPSQSESNEMSNFLNVTFKTRIPCYPCRMHYSDLISQIPPVLVSHDLLFQWGVDIHNRVNQRLRKPIVSYSQALAIWSPLVVIPNNPAPSPVSMPASSPAIIPIPISVTRPASNSVYSPQLQRQMDIIQRVRARQAIAPVPIPTSIPISSQLSLQLSPQQNYANIIAQRTKLQQGTPLTASALIPSFALTNGRSGHVNTRQQRLTEVIQRIRARQATQI